MIDMFKHSVVLFLQGRLFKDLGSVIRQATIGIAIAVILAVAMAKIGLPLWVSIAVASVASGAAQPFLFKDLKYA